MINQNIEGKVIVITGASSGMGEVAAKHPSNTKSTETRIETALGAWEKHGFNFNGNAEEAFNFYKSVFGGEFANITRFKDLDIPENPIADHEADKIMHIALPIG